MKRIYLAGKIEGLTWDNWMDNYELPLRKAFSEINNGEPIQVLSPMRGKELLKDRGVITGSVVNDIPMCEASRVVNRDLNDVANCDILIVNFALKASPTSSYPSPVGTYLEIGFAKGRGKFIIGIVPLDYPFRQHYFFPMLDMVFVSVSDLCDNLPDILPR